jgi:hypothetical protein
MLPQYFNFTLMAANFTFNGNSSGKEHSGLKTFRNDYQKPLQN